MEIYLPYLASIICALISGFTSYLVARKQMKESLEKLATQYKLDIEKEREKFSIEKEKMKLQHKYELERQQKQFENQIGGDVINTMFAEVMKMPEVKRKITQGINKPKKKNG